MGEVQRPFRGSEALRDGRLTRHGLRTFRRLHRDVYVHRSVEVTALSRARAAWLWANGEAVLAGFSAAAVHGTRWIGGGEPATLIRRGSRRSVDGIDVRADALLPDEVCRVGEMLVTTPARTAFDLGRWLPVDRAVEVLDALCHDTGLRPAEISAVAGRHRGERGLASLCEVMRRTADAHSTVAHGTAHSNPTTLVTGCFRSGLEQHERAVQLIHSGLM